MRRLHSNTTLEMDLDNIMVEARTILLKKRRESIEVYNGLGFGFMFAQLFNFHMHSLSTGSTLPLSCPRPEAPARVLG
jgi:hypothetical protein